ncbi:hypothetical protein N7520_008783 [Penicillium odoratum]|uniref:uncharacterized protein n=1 Tax=Penicillium odoratum TaxID=1167516 RepID=UPI002548E828|nr:uncharacterized protein N7520_008783 [Penicillium odoratum]KAJ5751866.1 hypothetical protein N7520_008783 [Penicillium odoratum]
MCNYKGYYFKYCSHYEFKLQTFCKTVRRELDRINNPDDREKYDIPCTPNPRCPPRVLRLSVEGDGDGSIKHVCGGTWEGWDTNIVSWDVVPFCDGCWEEMRIPDVEVEIEIEQGLEGVTVGVEKVEEDVDFDIDCDELGLENDGGGR